MANGKGFDHNLMLIFIALIPSLQQQRHVIHISNLLLFNSTFAKNSCYSLVNSNCFYYAVSLTH